MTVVCNKVYMFIHDHIYVYICIFRWHSSCRCYPHSMHCALVEVMGTQTDKQKSSNKEMCDIINTVRKEAERLTKSGPKTNTFRKFRQVLSDHNRPVVTEADLEGMTLSQRVLLEGKSEMVFHNDVSQRWVSTIVRLMQLLTNWSALTLMYTVGQGQSIGGRVFCDTTGVDGDYGEETCRQ